MKLNAGITKLCKVLAVVLIGIGSHIVVHITSAAVSYRALIPANYSKLISYTFADFIFWAVYIWLCGGFLEFLCAVVVRFALFYMTLNVAASALKQAWNFCLYLSLGQIGYVIWIS